MTRILYFAYLRERIGRPEETLDLPTEVGTVRDLVAHLRGRGEPYASALSGDHVRFAVDQTHARPDDPVRGAAEVAIFPPMSGG